MQNFYVSLVGPLCGYYLRVTAANEGDVRHWAADKLGKMWCSVYKPGQIENKPHFDRAKVIGMRVELTVDDFDPETVYDNYY